MSVDATLVYGWDEYSQMVLGVALSGLIPAAITFPLAVWALVRDLLPAWGEALVTFGAFAAILAGYYLVFLVVTTEWAKNIFIPRIRRRFTKS